MNRSSIALGVLKHSLLTLRLNFRRPQPLIYGFVVPVLFLLAFGAVFRGEVPVLRNQMAQLLTISILGGACFGLPTSLVTERERGLWKHFRLLPLHQGWLLLGTLLSRVVLIALAGLLQILIAHLLYATPLPANPGLFVGAFLLVSAAFLGLGLLIAAWAEGVPSVQAIGQCLFLPMLMIGGVGVPLGILPDWACIVAGFMPGRYAVALLQAGYADTLGASPLLFNTVALATIGLAAGLAGIALFRWDNAQSPTRRARAWSGLALAAWLAVGGAAGFTGRLDREGLLNEGLQEMSPELLASISYDDLPSDNGLVARLALPFPPGPLPAPVQRSSDLLDAWSARLDGSELRRIRCLLTAASIADVSQDRQEAEISRLVFNKLLQHSQPEELRRALGWIILRPDEDSIPVTLPELGLGKTIDEAVLRQRNTFFAKKLLGRMLGKLREESRPH